MNFEKDLQGNIHGISEILCILIERLMTTTKKTHSGLPGRSNTVSYIHVSRGTSVHHNSYRQCG
jgi:hypothetical protein